MWIRLNFMDTDPIQSNGDSPILQKVQELTNVNMEYVEVSSASESETFNLMIAGGDYTELIYNFAKLYTGGIDSAIENDIIVDLSDYMDAAPCYQIEGKRDNVKQADKLRLNLYFDPVRRSQELIDLDIAIQTQGAALADIQARKIPLDDDNTISRVYRFYQLDYDGDIMAHLILSLPAA